MSKDYEVITCVLSLKAKKQIFSMVSSVKKYVPGFEKAKRRNCFFPNKIHNDVECRNLST